MVMDLKKQDVYPFQSEQINKKPGSLLQITFLPLLALTIPLVKLMPPLCRWCIRSRFLRLYDEAERLDPENADSPGDTNVAENLRELDRIDHAVSQISVPRTYAGDLYMLRRDIDLIRRRLQSVDLPHDAGD